MGRVKKLYKNHLSGTIEVSKLLLQEKIGANLNQIAKKVNETHSIYRTDMDEIKGEMEKLWKVQKAMLKKQPVMSQ